VKTVEANSIAGGIMTVDPVCGMKVEEKKSEFTTQFAGKKYFFCSENCKQEFEADPDEFVETAAA
jgi:YHS domain-containing protein